MEKLKQRRKEKNLTQVELAQLIGVPQKYISYWENGKFEPSIENLKKLAKALDCKIDDIV